MPRFTLVILTCIAVVAPLAAQEHPLVGSWNVSFVAGARVGPNGTESITGTAKLTFEAKGDSLIGVLTPDPVDDAPARPPARLAALRQDGPVTFVVKSTAHLNLNGDERDATSVSTWVLGAKGDALSGTVARRLEGVEGLPIPAMEPSPVNGTRVKS